MRMAGHPTIPAGQTVENHKNDPHKGSAFLASMPIARASAIASRELLVIEAAFETHDVHVSPAGHLGPSAKRR